MVAKDYFLSASDCPQGQRLPNFFGQFSPVFEYSQNKKVGFIYLNQFSCISVSAHQLFHQVPLRRFWIHRLCFLFPFGYLYSFSRSHCAFSKLTGHSSLRSVLIQQVLQCFSNLHSSLLYSFHYVPESLVPAWAWTHQSTRPLVSSSAEETSRITTVITQ